MSNYIPNKIIQKVKKRANHCCEYCAALSQYSFHPFCIEHIKPKSKGGSNQMDNLAFSCQNCNSSKYDKTTAIDPLTQNEVPIFNPRTQSWSNHFIWNENKTIILGLTSTGRATIHALKMNRTEVQNLRAALYKFGVHPPKIS